MQTAGGAKDEVAQSLLMLLNPRAQQQSFRYSSKRVDMGAPLPPKPGSDLGLPGPREGEITPSGVSAGTSEGCVKGVMQCMVLQLPCVTFGFAISGASACMLRMWLVVARALVQACRKSSFS